jgi:hypothetical protein
MTAVDVLDDRVLPFYEEHAAEVEHVLTDNGREYCGRELRHHFELFLAISRTLIATSTSTIASAPIAVIAPKAGLPIRPS